MTTRPRREPCEHCGLARAKMAVLREKDGSRHVVCVPCLEAQYLKAAGSN